jgi:hypothetical protein
MWHNPRGHVTVYSLRIVKRRRSEVCSVCGKRWCPSAGTRFWTRLPLGHARRPSHVRTRVPRVSWTHLPRAHLLGKIIFVVVLLVVVLSHGMHVLAIGKKTSTFTRHSMQILYGTCCIKIIGRHAGLPGRFCTKSKSIAPCKAMQKLWRQRKNQKLWRQRKNTVAARVEPWSSCLGPGSLGQPSYGGLLYK